MRRDMLFLLLSLTLCVLCGGLAWAAAPVIEDVQIDRGRDTDAPDWPCYHQRVVAIVSDADGAGDVASVTVTDPSGADYTVTPDGGGSWWEEDANTIGCEWSQWRLLDPPEAGAYTVLAADAGANADTLITPDAPAVSETHPDIVAPAMGSVIYETIPTFEWSAGIPGSSYRIIVEEEGTWDAIWSADVAGTQCDYDFDHTATQAELQANHSCFWSVESSYPDDDRVSDPRVAIYTVQYTRGRFTVYGAWPEMPPELEGQFVYSICFSAYDGWNWGMSSIMGYNRDPTARMWVASDFAQFPDWSPDGSKLLYGKEPGLWIDGLDGSSPVLIPGTAGWGDCRWASDSNRVVYTVWGPPSPYTPWNNDIWVCNTDGTNQYPLVDSIESQDRYPEWSPDGLWIAYRKLTGPGGGISVGQGLWLIRYDRTEDHALSATGVVGYPGFEVTYMGEHDWSPDGSELAVLFSADLDPDAIQGIGVIPRDGGLITPVFIAPPAAICCSAPHLPKWSPDGTQIVFTSGHHLSDYPVELEWSPGPELWLANADGSGEPVRLTHDNGFNFCVAWWGVNTEVGEDVTVTKGDTTVTFEQVSETGNTSVTVYEEPIGLPVHYEFCQDYYEITTTADISGPITICMEYLEEDVPTGMAEEDLAILHYVEEGDYWEDITVSRDPDNNVVCGETESLSVFVLSAGPPSHFSDVPGSGFGVGGTESHWAYDEVEACAGAKIVGGYPDGSYQPEWDVTRAQMAVFIGRALVDPMGEDGMEDYQAPASPTFPDVPDYSWCYKHVELLYEKGVVEGYADGLYRPATWVSRDQMAVYIARAVADPIGEEGLEGYTPPAEASFLDVDAEHWAYNHIEYCAERDIVGGYSDGLYRPGKLVTRDQMAVYVARAFGLM